MTELKYIVAGARGRYFDRAAQACFVSQPTLSVAVKNLEEELDVKLFERGASEISVTPLGEEIVRQAQQFCKKPASASSPLKNVKSQAVCRQSAVAAFKEPSALICLC